MYIKCLAQYLELTSSIINITSSNQQALIDSNPMLGPMGDVKEGELLFPPYRHEAKRKTAE